jgi:23S rRNA pseudouridine2457 synthase
VPTIALHKPYGVLSRFTPDGSAHRTLATLDLPRDVWPVGRLDADSEGLLVLSSDKTIVDRLLNPRRGHARTYWVQVEGMPSEDALGRLRAGVTIGGERTRPALAAGIEAPALPDRDPPIRFRKTVPTAWIALTLTEGKNRQVRRMTAAVGLPTLRLVRAAIGAFALGDLPRGAWRTLDDREIALLLSERAAEMP